MSKAESLASGEFTSSSSDETAQLTSEAIGQCVLLKDIIEIDYEDIANFYGWHDEQNTEV